jgi:hypothetical protein
MTHA